MKPRQDRSFTFLAAVCLSSVLGSIYACGATRDTVGGEGDASMGGSGGTPTGSAGGSSSNETSVCSSNSFWRSGEGPSMRPGEACISCHAAEREAPKFVVAGSVYPTSHEPSDCNGTNSGGKVVIVITDANNTEHTLNVNSVGNFYLEGSKIALPYRATVKVGDNTRSMGASQTSGDCNSCHTEFGANGAPGRITLP